MRMPFALLLTLALFASTHAAELVGKWTGEFDSPVGHQKYEYEFKKDGDKLTGKAKADIAGEKYSSELKEIKISGDEVKFTEALNFQGTDLTITYTGKMSEDQIKLIRKVGDFGTEEFTAKRAKADDKKPEDKK